MKKLLVILLLLSSSFGRIIPIELDGRDYPIVNPKGVYVDVAFEGADEFVKEYNSQSKRKLLRALRKATQGFAIIDPTENKSITILEALNSLSGVDASFIITDNDPVLTNNPTALAYYSPVKNQLVFRRKAIINNPYTFSIHVIYHELTHYFQHRFGYYDEGVFSAMVSEFNADFVAYQLLKERYNFDRAPFRYWMYNAERVMRYYTHVSKVSPAVYHYIYDLAYILEDHYSHLARSYE